MTTIAKPEKEEIDVPEYVSRQYAAKMFGVTRHTVTNLCRQFGLRTYSFVNDTNKYLSWEDYQRLSAIYEERRKRLM